MKLETLNSVNCPRRNPKRSAKYVYHTWTLALSIARAGTFLAQRKRGKSEFRQVHGGPPFHSRLRHQERTTLRTPTREEAGRQGILHRQQAQEEVQKKVLPGYPRSIGTK